LIIAGVYFLKVVAKIVFFTTTDASHW